MVEINPASSSPTAGPLASISNAYRTIALRWLRGYLERCIVFNESAQEKRDIRPTGKFGAMLDAELCLAIRKAYRHAMNLHESDAQAMVECTVLLRNHRPGVRASDARRFVASMLAEEPLG